MKLKTASTLVFSSLIAALPLTASAASNISVNVKDGKSSHQYIHVNDMYKVSFGGLDNIKKYISQEFSEILNDDKFKVADLPIILEEIFFDSGWSNLHGVEGVTLYSMDEASFTLGFRNGDSGAVDTLTFYGSDVTAIFEGIADSNINIKDKKSRLAIFDVETEKSSFWIGGGRSDAARIVSEEFADITGGSKIKGYQVPTLLEHLVEGKADLGIEGVTLIGLNSTSFAIDVRESSYRSERIIFRGDVVEKALSDLTASAINQDQTKVLLDTGDGWSKVALWDTDSYQKAWISKGNTALDDLVGFEIKLDEVGTLINAALSTNGIEGVKVTSMTGRSITLSINAKGSTVDTLIISGQAVYDALNN